MPRKLDQEAEKRRTWAEIEKCNQWMKTQPPVKISTYFHGRFGSYTWDKLHKYADQRMRIWDLMHRP